MATIAIGISPKAGGGATTTVPVNALAEDGVPPEEGDSVSFSVQGKVQSVSGGNATVSIDSINGEPVGEESSESSEEEAGEEQSGGSSGSPTPQASSLANPNRSPLAPMGPSTGLGMGLARNRLDRAGTAAIRNRLMQGARNKPLPF